MSNHIDPSAHFAKTVLMPGDPLRAKFIANNFLVDYEEVTSIRGILGFTGHTKDGKEISVMASGMGCPSIGIYAHELFTEYGVEQIVRIGTAGSLQPNIHVGDIIIGTSACSNSGFASSFVKKGIHLAPVCDFSLLTRIYNTAIERGIKVHVGSIFSSDCFYYEDKETNEWLGHFGVLGVEMEAYALYLSAMELHKKALCLLTVSDSSNKGEKNLTQFERETLINDMVSLGMSLAE